jgi:hypothetical protein
MPDSGQPGSLTTGDGDPRPRSARRIIFLLILLAVVIMGLQLVQILHMRNAHFGGPRVGDGKDPATYGFDLTTTLVPRGEIVASGMSKNGLKAMDLPALITADALEPIRRERKSAYLVSGDRVIGVEIEGRARAYPIRVMNWHEVVNDTLGGRAIAVTYSPLCDAVVVFDRDVEGETLRFGVSGLLYNSNTLMYDARPAGSKESLWSQLQFRAVVGPAAAAGESLKIVPSYLGVWSDWLRRHPATTILAPEGKEMFERYKVDVYGTYFDSPRLRFPVRPLPPDLPKWYKEPVEVDSAGAVTLLSSFDRGVVIPHTSQAHALYFAWYAMHPEMTLSNVEPAKPIPPTAR